MHGGSATTLSEGWFRYNRAGGWVLRGLDVAFSAGAVHAVVGGNGCGKSTMLSVLAKTAKLQRGRMVNRVRGDLASQLHERHDASDFETKTQDKLAAKQAA